MTPPRRLTFRDLATCEGVPGDDLPRLPREADDEVQRLLTETVAKRPGWRTAAGWGIEVAVAHGVWLHAAATERALRRMRTAGLVQRSFLAGTRRPRIVFRRAGDDPS